VNETMSGTDPWSPVDESRTTVNEVEPDAPVEVREGDVTAHINLGGDEPTEEEKTAADDSDTEEEQDAAEVEEAEQTLAEKLAALDAIKSAPKKTKK
jgi:hypothetical protein